MQNLIDLVKEFLAGDHIWDYHAYLDSNEPEDRERAEVTENIITKLEEALDDPFPIPIHVEMHGGLFEQATCPIETVMLDTIVFYTNKNDFQGPDDHEQQINSLRRIIAQTKDKEKLNYYFSLRDMSHRQLLVKGAECYILVAEGSPSKLAPSTEFHCTIKRVLDDDAYVVRDTDNGHLHTVHLDDILLPDYEE